MGVTMSVRTLLVTLCAAMAAASGASAASAQSCKGVFVRNSQSYDEGQVAGTLVNKNVVVPKGTQDSFVGYVIVAGKKYYVQYRAYFHDPADIKLAPGCALTKWPYG
jgi:hypothetical protein